MTAGGSRSTEEAADHHVASPPGAEAGGVAVPADHQAVSPAGAEAGGVAPPAGAGPVPFLPRARAPAPMQADWSLALTRGALLQIPVTGERPNGHELRARTRMMHSCIQHAHGHLCNGEL